MQKVKQNYIAELIIISSVAIALLTSCSNRKHKLYDELSNEEKVIYNSLTKEERVNVNKNTYLYQLRQALDTTNTN